MHPTDGRTMTVELDDTITAQEAVAQLIAAEFIRPDSQGYTLAIKGGNIIPPHQSFRDAGVQNSTAIRVTPATDAGNNK
jgi:hypothetical protein